MTTTINPQELARAVHDQIFLHPETHDQTAYFSIGSCGTTACVAGWSLKLAGCEQQLCADGLWRWAHPVMVERKKIPNMAAALLDLSLDDAGWLFWDERTREEVLNGLNALANGDREKFAEISSGYGVDQRYTADDFSVAK
jgi:hypothetical protein